MSASWRAHTRSSADRPSRLSFPRVEVRFVFSRERMVSSRECSETTSCRLRYTALWFSIAAKMGQRPQPLLSQPWLRRPNCQRLGQGMCGDRGLILRYPRHEALHGILGSADVFVGGVLCTRLAWVMGNQPFMVPVRAEAEVSASPRLSFSIYAIYALVNIAYALFLTEDKCPDLNYSLSRR
jgi:hypothetical protein